jgi:hypothetical protein
LLPPPNPRAIEARRGGSGGDDHPERVQFPPASRPDDANGFPSKSVHGNYLSHLNILEDALRDGLETVWILEDDAIFSRRMVREQARVIEFLQHNPWDMCFLGHTLRRELHGPDPLLGGSSDGPTATPSTRGSCPARALTSRRT